MAGKRAVIFGANFITEYMLYSFLFPFPLLPVYYIPGHLGFYPKFGKMAENFGIPKIRTLPKKLGSDP